MRKEDTILVIDMQKVYQPGNPWACAHVNEAAQQIETLLDHVLELRDAPSVLLTRYIAAADEDAQGVWADYNRENRAINENPVMNEFIPAIARYVEEFPYIDKCTYSCFSNEYVRVAADRIVYLTDACAGVDADSERAVQTILQGLSPLHVELMTTAEYIAER